MAHLQKKLTLSGLTMIVIGSCIGSGIFISPSESFKFLDHHGYVLLTWLLGGLVTYLGAITFSELSARHPETGGVYVFLREAYGGLAGFLYGWSILLIVNSGALAALSVAFAEFLGFFIQMGQDTKTMVSIATISLLTIINVLGVDISQQLAKMFTGLKLLALGSIIFLGLYLWTTGGVHHPIRMDLSEIPDHLGQKILLAFIGVFWSYGGWHHATYLSGETIDSKKNIPKAMLLGTMTVTAVYILVLATYSILLPMADLASSTRIAGDAVGHVISGGGKLVTVAIAISIFGTIGIYTMSAPRIYFEMAKDKVFFPGLAKIHHRYNTPYVAMLIQGFWAIILIGIWGKFSRLMTFVTFMDIIFMALASASIFLFRIRDENNNVSGGFRVRYYPVVPLIYCLILAAFVINTFFAMNKEAIVGLGIVSCGIPVYWYFQNHLSSSTPE